MRGSSARLSRRLAVPLIVLVVGTFSLTASSLTATAAVAGTTHSTTHSTTRASTVAVAIPRGWFAFATSRPANSQVRTVQGVKGSDGQCRYDLKQTVRPGGSAARADELARNLTTCQSLFSVTPLSAQQATSRPAGPGYQSATTTRTHTAGVRPGTARPGTVYDDGAYIYAWWEDPVGITVNSVESDLWWYEDGTCASLDNWYGTDTWYTPSGWSRDYGYSDGGENGCEYAYNDGTAHFYNHTFCVGSSTDTYYYQAEVDGYYDGSFIVDWNTNTLGSCGFLLSVHEQWGYL